MEYRGKRKCKLNYPSFTLVMRTHLLRRTFLQIYRPKALLLWHTEPHLTLATYDTHNTHQNDDEWMLRTIVLHEDSGSEDGSSTLSTIEEETLEEEEDEPSPPIAVIEPEQTADRVSLLDLDGDAPMPSGAIAILEKRPRRVERVFHTCKSFLAQKLKAQKRSLPRKPY